MTPEKCSVNFNGEILARAGVLWACPKARVLLWSQALCWAVYYFLCNYSWDHLLKCDFFYLSSDQEDLKDTFSPQSGGRKPIRLHDFFWICGFVIRVDLLITAQAVPRGTRHSWAVFCALCGPAAAWAQWSASSWCPVQELLQWGCREVCWKGVCLKLNQSRNLRMTFGTNPCSLNTPKGCLQVIFPLKRYFFREVMKHSLL